MPTPISSSTAYASAADLLNAHDAGKVGDYATDSGARLSEGQILAPDAKVTAALLRASGEVEMACYRGERYTPTMLAALTGASAAALKGLVCDLAFYHLAKRRMPNPESVPGYKEAMEKLEALRDGELIFGLQEVADAAKMEAFDTSKDANEIYNRPSDMARRFFGRRMDDHSSNPLTGFQ